MWEKNLDPTTYDFKAALAKCTCIDDYGFHFKHEQHWRKETKDEEINRLSFNITLYGLYLDNGSRFPSETVEARRLDFVRLQQLQGLN